MKITTDLVIFITGAGSGLGEAAAFYFLFKGCKVALIGDIEDQLKRVKNIFLQSREYPDQSK